MKERRTRHPLLKAKVVKWIFMMALSLTSTRMLSAQQVNCDQVAATARMARAKSFATLNAEKPKAGNTYRARLVFAARKFQLDPKSKHAAEVLLESIPKDDEQQTVLIELGDSLCDGESLTDMQSLARVGETLPQNLARAVLIVPEKLPAYVAYALTSIQDPHSDYAVQMEIVCRARHAEFIGSVGELSSDKNTLFVKRVFSPETCKALSLPEAE